MLVNAQTTPIIQDMKVVQDGFPFAGATATYKQVSEATMDSPNGQNEPTIKIISESYDMVKLKYTLTGLKFTKIDSKGNSKIKLT